MQSGQVKDSADVGLLFLSLIFSAYMQEKKSTGRTKVCCTVSERENEK